MTDNLVERLRIEADNPRYMAGDGFDWCEVNAEILREAATLIETQQGLLREAREACAKVADRYRDEAGGSASYRQACFHIASSIRALSPDRVNETGGS